MQNVWSLGVILFMLVAGRAPFQEANDSETLTMIMDCKYQIPVHVSDPCQRLIKKMLVREPSDRNSLEQIEQDPWLACDAIVEELMRVNLPLLSREHVSEEDHSYVVQKMVEGKICTREEIFLSLERDAYDHIAATYYLLIERRLRKLHYEALAAQTNVRKPASSANIMASSKPHLEPLMLSPRSKRVVLGPNSPTSLDYSAYDHQPQRTQSSSSEHSDPSSLIQSLVSPPGSHPSPASASPKMTYLSPEAVFAAVRKCSLILEEAQNDDDDDDFEMDSVELKPSRSMECLDERISDLSASGSHERVFSPTSGGDTHAQTAKPPRPLRSVCSSPQLLNQIHEENESENEDDFVPSKLSAPHGRNPHNRMASPEILRQYEHRRRRKGTGQRGTSCSSSDASDTDDTEGKSRKEKLKHKFMHKHDSSDHSSDNDGSNGGGNIGGGDVVGNGGGGSKSSHKSGRRSGGGGGSGGGGSSGGGGNKSGKSHSKNQCFSDSRSSSDDPSDVVGTVNCSITQQYSSFKAVDENYNNNNKNQIEIKRNRLVHQKKIIGKEDNLGLLEGDIGLITHPDKISTVNVFALERGGDVRAHINNNITTAHNNNTITSLTSCLTSVVASSTHHQYTTHYNGKYLSNRKESNHVDQSVEFSEIPGDFCGCLKGETSVCDHATPSHRSLQQAHTKQNGVTTTFCKVGTGSSVVPVESKCCSVV